jgi:hypothetical protein
MGKEDDKTEEIEEDKERDKNDSILFSFMNKSTGELVINIIGIGAIIIFTVLLILRALKVI